MRSIPAGIAAGSTLARPRRARDTVAVETPAVIDRQIAALQRHESQVGDGAHLDELIRGWGQMVGRAAGLTKKRTAEAFRVVGNLSGADQIMRQALFVGTFPGLTQAMVDRMAECILCFVRSKR